MRGVSAERRGAAFGAILAAFDTGIGTGSTSIGWLIQRFGFRTAFAVAAGLSALALPYFLAIDRVHGDGEVNSQHPNDPTIQGEAAPTRRVSGICYTHRHGLGYKFTG